MKIVIGSSNEGKVSEFREMLKQSKALEEAEVLSLKDINFDKKIEENGKTFAENAFIKAKTISEFCKEKGFYKEDCIVICDDSGFIIDELPDRLGVLTARDYGGKEVTDREKNLAILNELKEKGFSEAHCHYIVDLCFTTDNIGFHHEKGEVSGKVVEPRGTNGFAFDEIFELESGKTFAELTAEEKNNISHRGLAMKEIINYLEDIFDEWE